MTLSLLTTAELLALPDSRWRVRKLFPEIGLAVIYGPSGSGKSFLALDLAATIARGDQWFHYRTVAGPVVYAALEAGQGMKLRAAALEKKKGAYPDITWVHSRFSLLDPEDMKSLVALLPPRATVIIDTLNQAAATIDENSSSEMGKVIQAAMLLAERIGGLVILVHHSGKNASAGPRGHSSLFAAADTVIEVIGGKTRRWRLVKQKESEAGAEHEFQLDSVHVGSDADGDDVHSCVVTELGNRTIHAPLPQGNQQQAVFKALIAGASGGNALPLAEAIEQAAAALTSVEKGKRRNRAADVIQALAKRGVVALSESQVSLPPGAPLQKTQNGSTTENTGASSALHKPPLHLYKVEGVGGPMEGSAERVTDQPARTDDGDSHRGQPRA